MVKVVSKKISEIKPYEKNPRKNDDAVLFVKNSIEKFGFKVPVVVDKDGVIVAGHTRYKAAIELGMQDIPVIVADDLTPAQIKAFRIADNKTAERASWDEKLLRDELSDILDDFDMTDFGFGDFELTILTEDYEPVPYDNEVVEKYSGNETEYLMKKRVIITYKDDQEEAIKHLLGLEKIEKVVYDIGEFL